MIKGLHHNAYRCRDSGETRKFYQDFLGLPLASALPIKTTRTGRQANVLHTFYEMGDGSELWRRSLYTYWKRALPPPSMMTFDAPTREFCITRRLTTNTPLQALVLWNDPQYVEASRVLAQRVLHEDAADDRVEWTTNRTEEPRVSHQCSLARWPAPRADSPSA